MYNGAMLEHEAHDQGGMAPSSESAAMQEEPTEAQRYRHADIKNLRDGPPPGYCGEKAVEATNVQVEGVSLSEKLSREYGDDPETDTGDHIDDSHIVRSWN